MNHIIKIEKFEEKPWALCSSLVIMSVDGKQFRVRLHTGGAVWFDEHWCEHVEDGPWSLWDIPDEFKHLKKELTDVINKEIIWGCCGGCV